MIVLVLIIVGVVIYLISSEKRELKNEVKENVHLKRMLKLYTKKEKIAIIVFLKWIANGTNQNHRKDSYILKIQTYFDLNYDDFIDINKLSITDTLKYLTNILILFDEEQQYTLILLGFELISYGSNSSEDDLKKTLELYQLIANIDSETFISVANKQI